MLFDFCFPFCIIEHMAIATITKKLPKEIKTLVAQTVHDVLSDPDFGLELTGKVQKRLRLVSNSRKKNIPFNQIKKKYR